MIFGRHSRTDNGTKLGLQTLMSQSRFSADIAQIAVVAARPWVHHSGQDEINKAMKPALL